MPNDLPSSETAHMPSGDPVRDQLLRFLQLLAKDIVRRLADAGDGEAAQANRPETLRQIT